VKASFLCSFDAKHSAKTVCANLQDLTQKSGDSIFTYFSRNFETFKHFMSAKDDDNLQNIAAYNKLREARE